MRGSLDRRQLFQRLGLLGLPLLAAPIARAAEDCGLTPRQPQGPFYPRASPPDSDADLTLIPGHSERAAGQVIVVAGTVRDVRCRPLVGAVIEIWQACASGRYNHPNDDNTAPLDQHFQYWCRVTADADGAFSFRTVKPGAYPLGRRMRPPHIHFRIVASGFPTLVTQMYFDGEPLNATDRILSRVPAAQSRRIVVPFAATTDRLGALAGRFEIVVGSPGDTAATPEVE